MPTLDTHLLCSPSSATIKPGLGRMHTLLAALGNPHQTVPIIHVAGTNGKGSVCKLLESILHRAGLTVATTTSPHLVDITERITRNGTSVSATDWDTCQQQLAAVVSNLPAEDKPTYFEAVMLLAFLAFRHWHIHGGLDVAIVETGLGGRLDASNVVDTPMLTVITNIGLDHTEFLGETIAAIAAEKAGILKPGVPVVLGPAMALEAVNTITQQAKLLGCPVIMADANRLTTVNVGLSGQTIHDNHTHHHYQLPLLGGHQAENLSTALTAIDTLPKLAKSITSDAISAGVAAVQHAARCQVLANQHLIIDGSHNAEGWAALGQTIVTVLPSQPVHLLVAVKQTKPLDGLVTLVNQLSPTSITCTVGPHDAGPYHTAEAVQGFLLKQTVNTSQVIAAVPNLADAWQQFNQQRASAGQQAWRVVSGSLHMCGFILDLLG